MSRFVIAPRARIDLDEIWEFIAAGSIKAADRTVQRFYELFRMLARQPLIGEARNEIHAQLRCFPAGNYVIYYLPITSGVRVARIIHAARDVVTVF